MKKQKSLKNKKTTGNYLAKKAEKSFFEEIAKMDTVEGFSSVMNKLSNPDNVLRKTGKGYETLRLLMQEGQVATCVQSRKASTLALKYRFNLPESDEDREHFYDNVFKKLNLTSLISEILNAPLYGYQPIEIVWNYDNGFIIPQKIEAKPQEWFFFDKNKRLRIKLKGYSEGYIVDENSKKFLVPRHNGDYLNPYGLAILSLCFWDVAFKKGGMQFWMKFIEKYAMPYFIGKYEPGASDEEKQEILEMLVKMVQDAVSVIPNDSSVEIKEAAGKGQSAEIFQAFIEVMDKNIAKNILGQTLTTEAGETGSYALGKVHNEVREDISDSDKRLVEETINLLLLWIHESNFDDDNCPVLELYSPKQITKEAADIDKTAYDMGVRFSVNHFVRKYGYKSDEITLLEAEKIATQNFSESQDCDAQACVDEFIDSFSEEELNDIISEKIKPIIQEFSEFRDSDSAMDKLAEIYPKMETKQLEDTLTKAIFISDLWGRCQNQRGDK